MKAVAITGGLSCGKSSVCYFLEKLGAYVVSSDTIVHQLLSADTSLAQEVIKLLGKKIVVDQKINRSLVAQTVFENPKQLKQLEKLLHPAVYREIDGQYKLQKKKELQTKLFVAEIPLLFESEYQSFFETIVVVVADEKLAMKRFKQKTGLSVDHYYKRTARQIPIQEKMKRADEIIHNNEDLSHLKAKTFTLYHKLMAS